MSFIYLRSSFSLSRSSLEHVIDISSSSRVSFLMILPSSSISPPEAVKKDYLLKLLPDPFYNYKNVALLYALPPLVMLYIPNSSKPGLSIRKVMLFSDPLVGMWLIDSYCFYIISSYSY